MPFLRSGKDVRQNGIQLKNCQRALAAAHDSGSLDERTLAAATRGFEQATDAVTDPRADRRAGLALFAWQDQCVLLESDELSAPLVTIAPRFYLVPLLSRDWPVQPLHVLALSRHSVRLVEQATAQEIPLSANVPRSVTAVVGTERRAATLQRHATGTGTVFHGHGEGDDDVLPEIELFCRRVATTLTANLERADAVLILAGDVQIAAVFRRVATDLNVLEESLHGNHDRTPAAELAGLAEPIASLRQQVALGELKARYGARTADRRASDDAADIAAAAREGRIDTLLLDEDAPLDEPRRRAAGSPHTAQPEGPFNNEAVLTLRSGGDVRLVATTDMPTPAPHAAIYRF